MITSWNDADECIKRIGLAQILRDRAEGKLNEAITKLKEQYAPQIERADAQLAALRDELEAWCRARRHEMTEASKGGGLVWRGVFGKLAFRKCPPAVKLLKKAEKVLAALEARKLTHCIRTVEEPNLEAMHMLDDATLEAVGARRQPSEKFEVKPDYQAIAARDAAES